MSENINVRSILGRYLEHSRIFYFENSNGAQPHIFAGSADWMPRNFFRRIECIFPIQDPGIRDRMMGILNKYLMDTKNSRFLRADGSYSDARRAKSTQLICAQSDFADASTQRRKELKQLALQQATPDKPEFRPQR
jgi:polyphosphate kinase